MPDIRNLIHDFNPRQARQIADQALYRVGTVAQLASSTAETNIFSFDIPSDLMSGARAIRAVVLGTIFNNSGGANGATFKAKLNGTTQITDVTLAAIAAHATDYTAVELEYIIGMNNSVNAQSHFWRNQSAKGAIAASNVGAISVGVNSSAIDMSISRAMLVSVQLSANNANLKWTSNNVILEYL